MDQPYSTKRAWSRKVPWAAGVGCGINAGGSILIQMKLARFLAGLLLAIGSSLRADYTATVNPNSLIATNFQGWGSSLCWWANVVGGFPNRQDYANLAFGQLKLNIVRYNIGGGENPSLTNTITDYRAIMQGFEPTNGVWNWNADTNQRWMLRAALGLGANHVVAFANSPPWWMTVSGSVTGAVNGTNNLQVGYENDFAIYLATVVSNLGVLDGVHFDYVTPMNEPSDAWKYANGKQEGCHMSISQQSSVVAYLDDQLALSAPSSGIDAPEDYSEQESVSDLDGYTLSSLDTVALVTTHTYSANDASGLRSVAASINRPLWVDEYGDSDGTGLTMARRIHDDITELGARAWVYWQVVDNAAGWGFLYNPLAPNANGSFTTTYTVNEKFYVMGQFSEFIRPGCNIISVSDTNTLAAYNPANGSLTLVAINTGSSNFNVTYNLSSFPSLGPQVAVYQTSSSEQIAQLSSLSVTNGQFTASLPAGAVTTFVLTSPLHPQVIDSYAGNLLSYGPAAWWRLNEGVGTNLAYDWIRGFNGSYGADTTNGQPGIPNPPFHGVPRDEFGVFMDHSGGTNGFVTTPPLGLTVSNATLLCWVYPAGNQSVSEGLVFSRGSSGAVNGINFGANNGFSYTWANNPATYDWSSGLTIPPNMWSFLALVITPTNATGFVFNANGQASAVNSVTNPPETLATGFTIGADPQSSTLSYRILNGEMDEVAVFNYALTVAQLSQIYSVANTGLTLSIQQSGSRVVLTWPFGVLYGATNVSGPWQPVTNAVSPFSITASATQKFYSVIAAP